MSEIEVHIMQKAKVDSAIVAKIASEMLEWLDREDFNIEPNSLPNVHAGDNFETLGLAFADHLVNYSNGQLR